MFLSVCLKGEIMHRILMIALAVPALSLFGLSQTAQAQHYCGHGGGYYGGGYGYSRPIYSAPVYSYRPVYRTAYVRPSYGIGIGVGRTYGGYGGGYSRSYGGGYYGGNRGGYYGGHHHHHHY